MSIPDDIKAAARAALEFEIMETVEIKGVPTLLRNIERALMAERERCANVAEALDRGGREWVSNSLWANIKRDTAKAIRKSPHPEPTNIKPSKKGVTEETE
jgi:hypothetical protein